MEGYQEKQVYGLKIKIDYYSFGSPMPGRNFSSNSYRYGFNGQEKDDEIKGSGNSLDFGERIYDPRIGRWLSPDPEHQFKLSPYLSFANNPILFTDPDGGWIPGVDDNGRIILTAEKGDNLGTLYSFFGGKENAAKYLPSAWVGKVAPKFIITTGTQVGFNSTNAFSKAVADAAENPKKYEQQGNEGDQTRNYNCHTCAVGESKGEEFHDKSNMDIDVRNGILKGEYENVTSGEAVFGETIITYGDQHSANFFGKSQDGTVYIFTKNGTAVAPTVDKAVNLTSSNQDEGPGASYGAVGNPNSKGDAVYEVLGKDVQKTDQQKGAGGSGIKTSNGTGYFNPKKDDSTKK